MPRLTRVPLAQRLDELAERLGLRAKERQLAEGIAKGWAPRRAGVEAGYSASSPAVLDAAVSRALARPRVEAYLAELKQIGLAATAPTMARLMGAQSPGPSAVIAARAAAIQAVKRHGWAKVQKKVVRGPNRVDPQTGEESPGPVVEVHHTRTVDAANAARVLMEDHRSTENAKMQAQATLTAAAARSIGDMARAAGVDLRELWSESVLAAGDNAVEVDAVRVEEEGEPEPEPEQLGMDFGPEPDPQ